MSSPPRAAEPCNTHFTLKWRERRLQYSRFPPPAPPPPSLSEEETRSHRPAPHPRPFPSGTTGGDKEGDALRTTLTHRRHPRLTPRRRGKARPGPPRRRLIKRHFPARGTEASRWGRWDHLGVPEVGRGLPPPQGQGAAVRGRAAARPSSR